MNLKIKRTTLLLAGWLILIYLSFYPSFIQAAPAVPETEPRVDGLTVIKAEIPKEDLQNLCVVSLVTKTGYANDPEGKAGLTELMNLLLYKIFLNSSALDVDYHTYATFSKYNFVVSARDFKTFISELDSIIRADALLLYDECNQLIQDYRNQPRIPGSVAETNLYRMLYGNNHPYLSVFNENFTELNIDSVNNWFRKVFRPNNLLIASTTGLPDDFLKKPSGREMNEAVNFPKIPAISCVPKPVISYNQVQDNVSTIYVGLPGSSITEYSIFPMIATQRYLQKELWDVLRENMGLCYDVQVGYSYLQESNGCSLTISLATLPGDADVAVAKIIDILTGLATNPLSSTRLSSIKDQEKNRIDILYSSIFRKVDGLVYEKLFGQTWLQDSEAYMKSFDKITSEEISKFTTQRLKYIKIAVAGPSSSETFEESYQAISRLNKSVK